MKKFLKSFCIALACLLGFWLFAEIVMRLYLELPLKTDFYSSIPQPLIPQRQSQFGVQVTTGLGWAHLGWIADPERETYLIMKLVDGKEQQVGSTRFGSFLLRGESGVFRVWGVPKNGVSPRLLGEVTVSPSPGASPIFVPRIATDWRVLFRPTEHGFYINDHTIYQDSQGNWRLVGITSKSDGDYNAEKYFAVGASQDFPPQEGMLEAEPIADFGTLAWAPHIIRTGESYHMFWSPHQLHHMTSKDGITWENHAVIMPAPWHKFFRDPMVLQVGPNQWLLYTTARGAYFSQVDIYQSFDLQEWQYIRSALLSSWGSERNSPFASMESPFVTQYQGHYYLSLTYNNDSFFLPGILMLFRIWPDRASYNETLVFHSDNPYDFGVYRGKGNSPSLLTQLEAHAPEVIYQEQQDAWYITTAGWPWVATLTTGEVAVAELQWQPQP